MTIEEAKALIKALQEKMTADAQSFIDATGLHIHSIPITITNGKAAVLVKVQIPE